MESFDGIRRADGRVGIRNYVVVLPVSVATSPIAARIANGRDGVRATPHELGADLPPPAREQIERTLVGIGRHPNVGAVLVLDLGTETIDVSELVGDIAVAEKPVERMTVRDVGGTAAAIERGTNVVGELRERADAATREEVDARELILGVECGGSDATSGIAANPAVGNACDRLVGHGGTACIAETPEFIGAEHILADRCVDEETRRRLLGRVSYREGLADFMGVDMRGAQPTPGNQAGGLTTIEEKSLGAIAKGGTGPVRRVVDYAARIRTQEGLVVMDTPGYDVESVVGMVAGGAHAVAFTTGRGSTTGNPIAPVIKVTGNPDTWSRMARNMDLNASTIFDGESLDSIGERLYRQLLLVADGAMTAAEQRGLEEFAINEIHPGEPDRNAGYVT